MTMLRQLPPLACLLAVTFTAGVTSSCVHSTEDAVSLNDAVDEDSDYFPVFSRNTRKADVTKDFELRYKVAVTYLAPEFRSAMGRRHEKLFQQNQPTLEEASQKAGFFVSIYSEKKEWADVSNHELWNITLKTKDGDLKPATIRKLTDKDRWKPFFAQVTPWSQEFLVVFDTPAANPQSPELVDNSAINLKFANADAQVALTW